MRALCRHGKLDVRVDTPPNPTIGQPPDAIVKVTTRPLGVEAAESKS
jgi:hypothetical protein